MVLYSEQINHPGILIVFSCHLIQCSLKLTSRLVMDTRYTYNNDIRHEIFQLTQIVSTQKHCASLTVTRELWEFYNEYFVDFRFVSSLIIWCQTLKQLCLVYFQEEEVTI
jgi:hypothetical protein